MSGSASASMQQQCAASDNSFGPVVDAGCRGGFDFTLKFEQGILGLVPYVLFFALLFPLRLFQLWHRAASTAPADVLGIAKVSTAFILGAAQLTSVIFWAGADSDQRPSTAMPAAVLSFLAACAVTVLSYGEHTRSRRPSVLLGAFLSLTLLFDLVPARTLWLRVAYTAGETSLAVVATAGLATKALLVILEAVPKQDSTKSASREAVSGPYSLGFFWWLNTLFLRGFHTSLKLDDLSALEDAFASDVLARRMQQAWDAQAHLDSPRRHRSRSLPVAVGSALKYSLLVPIPARLVFMAFSYAQPFLIMKAINYVQQPAGDGSISKDNGYGYGLIGAAALVYLGIAISRGQYNYQLYRSVTKVRGCLVGLIYHKTLTAATADTTAPGGNSNAKAALTLMSADVDRIALTVEKVYEIGAGTVEVAIAVWLLERQIGWACIAPLVLAAVSLAGNTAVAARTPGRLKQWTGAMQDRVSLTATILRHMRAIKAMGQAPQVFDTLQAARAHELERSAHFRLLVALMNLFGALPRLLAAPLAFALFVFPSSSAFFSEGGLTAARAFTTLSLLELLTTPLGTVLQSIPQVTAAKACLDRIQDFLQRDDIDPELAVPAGNSSVSDVSSVTAVEGAIEMMAIAVARGRPVRADAPVIELENVSLRYPTDGDAAVAAAAPSYIVRDLSLKVTAGQLVMVVGPAGCGKTTLLRAVAGSLVPAQGHLARRHAQMAYCQQTPWLINTTVRANIVGPSLNGVHDNDGDDSGDDAWYNTVRKACALDDKDAQETMPEGDEVVGSGGAVLSGGQKQRVALARAIYARKPVVVLDDVLSALDAETEHVVFSALVAPGGLLRRGHTTVIMATSSLHHLALAEADLVLSMHADGTTTQHRSYAEMGEAAIAEIERSQGVADAVRQQKCASQNTEANTAKVSTTKAVTADKDKEKEKERARRTGDVRSYQTYGRSMGWARAWVFLVIAVAFAVVSRISQYWVTQFTDNVDINRGLLIGVYFLFAVSAVVLSLVSFWWMMIVIIPVSGSNLHTMLLTTVFHAPLSFITSTDVGVILNRFSQDMHYATAYLPISTMNTVTTILVCIVQFAFIATSSGYLAIALPFLVGVVYLLQKFYLATSRQLRFLDLEYKSPLYTALTETIEGLPTIRAFGWARPYEARFLSRLDDSQRPVYMLYCIQRWLNLVLDLIVAALAVLLLALATQLTSLSASSISSATAAAALGLAMINMLGFGQSLSQFIFYYTELETSLGAIARIREYVTDIVPEDGPPSFSGPNSGGGAAPPLVADSWPERGDVKFDHMTASYGITDGDGNGDAPDDVLRDVTLHIPAGKIVGLRGRTGSGKSSVTLALLRLLDLRAGTISIDGVDLATLPRQTVRSRITTVPQDPFFPPTHSLRRTLAGTAGDGGLADAELLDALDTVGLLDHVVNQLGGKDGGGGSVGNNTRVLDAPMSDLPLSAGQQQQFCLASALLQRNQIMILDEFTSAMDAATEARVRAALQTRLAGKTVLMVAHRTAMLEVCDVVVEIDNGRVVSVVKRDG